MMGLPSDQFALASISHEYVRLSELTVHFPNQGTGLPVFASTFSKVSYMRLITCDDVASVLTTVLKTRMSLNDPRITRPPATCVSWVSALLLMRALGPHLGASALALITTSYSRLSRG